MSQKDEVRELLWTYLTMNDRLTDTSKAFKEEFQREIGGSEILGNLIIEGKIPQNILMSYIVSFKLLTDVNTKDLIKSSESGHIDMKLPINEESEVVPEKAEEEIDPTPAQYEEIMDNSLDSVKNLKKKNKSKGKVGRVGKVEAKKEKVNNPLEIVDVE